MALFVSQFFNFDEILFIHLLFSLGAWAFGVIFKKPWTSWRSQRFAPMFSSNSFIVLAFTFRPIIHFKLISVNYVKQFSMFTLSHVAV